MTISRDVIVARSETLNNHIAWERFLISRFFARPEAVHEICGLQSGRDHIPWADESAMELQSNQSTTELNNPTNNSTMPDVFQLFLFTIQCCRNVICHSYNHHEILYLPTRILNKMIASLFDNRRAFTMFSLTDPSPGEGKY